MIKIHFWKKKPAADGEAAASSAPEADNRTEQTRTCRICGETVPAGEVKDNFYICPKCGGYFRVHARHRINMITDPASFTEWNENMTLCDPINFPGYAEKIGEVRQKTRLDEAVVTGRGTIGGYDAVICVCDSRYLSASMGHNMGEKITFAVEEATRLKLPVIIYAASGGARMQEGLASLMQMAKTSAALKRHSEANLLYISILTDPTTGGVTASFAMLGDIILAEPDARIGFAGPRVIEQTINQKLPEGFQSAQFQLEHGFVDMIVERKDQKKILTDMLRLHSSKNGWQKYTRKDPVSLPFAGFAKKRTFEKISGRKNEAWDVVRESRKANRITAAEYIEAIFDDRYEFHGDREYGDDGAIVGGIASFDGMPVTVIAEERGRNAVEAVKHNFGMPSPEGYRKALRLMRQAEKFNRPVICFVDTNGAYPGKEAEERGQGEAIARNLFEMSSLKVPVLAIVTGQGGSGGALALAVANEVWMLENATYSIISPEGFASILWKDPERAPEAAGLMKMTSADLGALGFIERIISEDSPAVRDNIGTVKDEIVRNMREFFAEYAAMTPEVLAESRYLRFRKF